MYIFPKAEDFYSLQRAYELVVGQLRSMGSANVELLLKDKKSKDTISCLRDQVTGITSNHVALIRGSSKLEKRVDELTSRNEFLEAEVKRLTLVFKVYFT